MRQRLSEGAYHLTAAARPLSESPFIMRLEMESADLRLLGCPAAAVWEYSSRLAENPAIWSYLTIGRRKKHRENGKVVELDSLIECKVSL